MLEKLPGWVNTVVGDLLNEVHRLDERIGECDRHVATMVRQDERAQRLMRLSGVGEMTATALSGPTRFFKENRRQRHGLTAAATTAGIGTSYPSPRR